MNKRRGMVLFLAMVQPLVLTTIGNDLEVINFIVIIDFQPNKSIL
jgi:hypothetical protein